jgi:hypothetical protein
MTDTETVLRAGLRALAESTPLSGPDLSSFDRPSVTVMRRRRKTMVATSIAGGLIVLAAGAAASGNVPEPVRSAFNRFAHYDEPFPLDPDSAAQVATATGPDGSRFEYWRASVKDGGTCENVDLVEAGGKRHDRGASVCSHDDSHSSAGPHLFVLGGTEESRGFVVGHAPEGTASIRVSMGDDSVHAELTPDRFFAVWLSAEESKRVASVEALRPDGSILDHQDYDQTLPFKR